MKIKRFEGRDMHQVLQQVKAEMGEEAVLLHTKAAKDGLWGSLVGRSRMEAWAAVDTPLNEGSAQTALAGPPVDRSSYTTLSDPGIASIFTDPRPEVAWPRPAPRYPGRGAGESCAAEASPFIAWRIGFTVHPAQPFAERLMQCGVDSVAAWEMAWDCHKSSGNREEFLGRCFQTVARTAEDSGVAQVLQGKTIALVGPTGAGKTTTVAKLAAQCLLDGTRRVALMNIDTYRIAAVEQLKTYARIMGVPLIVAETPEEAETRIGQARKEHDLILIDTIGRSQRNAEHLQSLREMVAACKPDEVHLVLPAVTSASDLLQVVDRFSALSANRFLFTKLDETQQPGVVAGIAWRHATPISFLTTGQSVPEDIEGATRSRLAEFVLEPLTSTAGAEGA